MISTEIEQKIASNYWVKKIKDAPVVNEAPLDILKTKKVFINNESISYFKKLTNENAIAEYTVLLSIFSSLVQRYFETESFIFSSKIDNDEISLLFKYDSIQGKPFKVYLQEVKKEVQETYQYSEYGKKLQENYPFYQYALYGFFYNSISSSIRKTSLPFSLSTNKNDGGLELSICYEGSFVKNYLVNHFLNTIKNWLLHLKSYIDESIDKISIVSALEKKQLLEEFNNTTVNYPKDKTVIDLFEKQVSKTPEATALVFEEISLTYSQLNEQSNRLAHYLRDNYSDISKGVNIGVLLDRSLESVVAMIGVIKSGYCYVPINSSYPKDRIDYIIKDGNIRCLLTQTSLISRFNLEVEDHIDLKSFDFSQNDSRNQLIINDFEDNAFIIYTSGSTGIPKGVVQTHKMLSNLINWNIKDSGISLGLRHLQYTSFSFDVSLQDCWFTFSGGGMLYISNKDIRLDFSSLLNYIVDNKLEVLSFPFSALNSLFNENNLVDFDNHEIKHIISSGEQLLVNQPLNDFLFKNITVKLHNHYGPSETHVVTSHTMSVEYENLVSYSPIGKPISNTQIYILDETLNPVPIGVHGEIYIGGYNLAQGYLNLLKATEERFIVHPIKGEQRLYKTGDLAFWESNGIITYLGRNDDQVKIRGYRIELGEIEQSILRFKGVKQVVAEVKNIGENKAIVVYIVSEEDIDKQSLREFISQSLPEYMIPSYFVDLDAIPLTENGKIDRKALPEVDDTAIIKKEYVAPRNEMEEQLAKIWQEVLGVEKIGIMDNFFELGGNSMSAINLMHVMKDKFFIEIDDIFIYPTINLMHVMKDKFFIEINDIFIYPTIEKLSERINEKRVEKPASSLENKRKKGKSLHTLKSIYIKQANDFVENIDYETQQNTGNVLLLGGTGFLGIHLLNQLVEKTEFTIYLIVRSKNGMSGNDRIRDMYNRHFGDYDTIKERVTVFTGEVTKELFGLKKEEYNYIEEKIGIVLNSAANVRHYGEVAHFHDININLVDNLLHFCKNDKFFHHVSTISVADSGSYKTNKQNIFTDNDCDLGQEYNNLYIKTKFEAEKLIVKSKKSLFYNIYRVGNLAFDSNTGHFQDNIDENAFFNNLKVYLKLGLLPEFLQTFDFSFVNETASAIVAILQRKKIQNNIFHVYNPNQLTNDAFVRLLKEYSIEIKKASLEEFKTALELNLGEYNQEIRKLLLSYGYYNDDKNTSKTTVYSLKTFKLLEKIGVKWSSLNKTNLQKLIDYMKTTNFI